MKILTSKTDRFDKLSVERGELMRSEQLLLRLIVFSIWIGGLHLVLKTKHNPKVKIKTVQMLHITVLTLFFTNVFGMMPYNPVTSFLFDMMWWTMAFIGFKTVFSLHDHFAKIDYMIVATSILFLLFIPLMIMLTNM